MPTQTAENAPIDSRFKEFIHYSELKQLAFKIEALQQEKAFRSLAVLSCLAGEGKTLFCAALAMAYVQTRRTSVLVIDTTTHQSEGSLVLKQCLGPSLPLVEEVSLEELRKGSDGFGPLSGLTLTSEEDPALVTEMVPQSAIHLAFLKENDLSQIKKKSADRSNPYGLVLLDTAPLNAKNKNNVDPVLVANLSDASVLLASQKFLNAPNADSYLKVLEDPALHLLGIISNEVFSS